MSNYTIIKDEWGGSTVTLFHNGNILQADNQHGQFDQIIAWLLSGCSLDGIDDLFSPEAAVSRAFAQLSSDVRIENGIVYYRDEPVNEALSEHLVRLHDAGEGYAPVVRFLEKLYQNPNPDSVERLWAWISDRHLTLSSTGNIIGYKGLRRDNTSVHAGRDDIRNGEPVNGHVLNLPGDVIEKDRNKVVFDVNIGCAEGLHVGDYSYASSFGQVVVKVEVNPADVVSVPADDSRKMRVCRYRVLEEVKREESSFYVESDWDDWDEDDDYEYDDFDINDPADDWDDEDDELVDDQYSDTVTHVHVSGYPTADDGGAILSELRKLNENISKFAAPNYSINFDGGLVGDPERQAKKVIEVLAKSNVPVDTRLNHLMQNRDENGRFKKKGK